MELWTALGYQQVQTSQPQLHPALSGLQHSGWAETLNVYSVDYLFVLGFNSDFPHQGFWICRDEQNTKNEDDNEPLQSVFVVTVIKR